MKSQTRTLVLLQVVKAIIEDIAITYPDTRASLQRDVISLETLVANRGEATFSLLLPELDRYLLRSLALGRLDPDIPMGVKVHKGNGYRRPQLFEGLWNLIFPDGILVSSTPDGNTSHLDAIFFLRQLCCVGKSIEGDCTQERIDKAVLEYIEIEEEMYSPILDWTQDILPVKERDLNWWYTSFMDTFTGISDSDFSLLDRWFKRSRHLFSRLGSFDGHPDEWLPSDPQAGGRHGPGAVADLSGCTDKYTFPNWTTRLEHIFPYHQWGCSNALTYMDGFYAPAEGKNTSRLIVVPKSMKSPRLIAAEPTSNMWCQQFLLKVLTHRAKSSGLFNLCDWTNQQTSRDMARRASLDGSLATIDLSSASDRLPLRFMEVAMSSNIPLMEAFHAMRTPFLDIRIGSSQLETICLKKFATQGTALTFPLQTLFFTSILFSVHEGTFKEFVVRDDLRVFGDDIIIPVDWYEKVTRLITLLGLKVNLDKSFHTGFFRESCGMDAYLGYDVTPIRPKFVTTSTDPSSISAVTDTCNNFFMKGLWRASKVLEDELHGKAANLPIKGMGDGFIGLVSFCGRNFKHLRSRWNKDYHLTEYRVSSVKTKVPLMPMDGRSRLLQYFTERPAPTEAWKSGVRGRPKSSNTLRWDPLL